MVKYTIEIPTLLNTELGKLAKAVNQTKKEYLEGIAKAQLKKVILARMVEQDRQKRIQELKDL
jgi:hypothetical protein